MDTEYAEEVVFQPPSDIGASISSKSIKDRLAAVNYLQQELNLQNLEPLFQIRELAPALAKEQNAAIMSKSLVLLSALIQSQKYSALKVLPLVLEHAGNIKQQIKNIVKEISFLASIENFDESMTIMSGFLTHKQPKVVAEVSCIMSEILSKSDKLDVQHIKLILPALQHSKEEVRKPCFDVLIILGQKIGKQAMIQVLSTNKVTPAQIATFTHSLQENNANDGDAIDNNDSQDSNQKYSFDLFDQNKPLRVPLAKNFDDRLKNTEWKERKAILEESLDMITNQVRIDPLSYDISKLITNIKNIVLEEKQVQVVQLAEKLLAQIAIKTGPISSVNAAKVLLQSIQNRLKEKKYAIINGYQVFIQSILVRSFYFKDIFPELFQVALPHKNQEVKEELLRVIKVISATSIVYNYKLSDEDLKINMLSNDQFPNPVFPTTEEEIPVSGEKSYGMQLNLKVHRQKSGRGMSFIEYFNVDGSVNIEVQFQQNQFTLLFDYMDKLLNDTNANIRDLSKKTVVMFLVFHIAEGRDAILRSNQEENIVFVFNQMFQMFIQYVLSNRRKNEMLSFIKDIAKFLNDNQTFNGFFDGQGVVFQEQEVNIISKNVQQKIQKPVKTLQQGNKSTYLWRKDNSSNFLVDPCNLQAPCTPQMMEEIYQQLQTFVPNASLFFVKGVVQATFGPSGSFKSIQENLQILINSNLNETRDIVLKYLSLLLADGFVAKSQASPLQSKLFIETLDKLVLNLQNNRISLNYYDLECILPVILQKFEQQQSNQLKLSILNTAEKLICVSENLEDFVTQSLLVISKSWKIQIRQVTTKVAILRFIAGLVSLFQQQEITFENITPQLFSSLSQFYLHKGSENFSLTESHLVQQIPIKSFTQKSLSLYVINSILQNCNIDIKEKLIISAQKFIDAKDLQVYQKSNFDKIQNIPKKQEIQNDSILYQNPQINSHNLQQPKIQGQTNLYQPQGQLQQNIKAQQQQQYLQAQQYQQKQQNIFQHQQEDNQYIQPQQNFRQSVQNQFKPSFSTPSALQNSGVYQRQQQKPSVQFNEKQLSTPINFSVNKSYSEQKASQYDQNELVEDLADFPDVLVDIPNFDSPVTQKNPVLQIKTPNLKEIMISSENSKYQELYKSDLNKQQNFSQLIQIIKTFIYQLRNEQQSIYLESQVEKLTLRLIYLQNAHIQLSLLQNGPTQEFYILSKYIIIALSELSQCELFHQSHIYKQLLQTIMTTTAIFSSINSRQWSYNNTIHIQSLISGLLIQIAEVSDICRYAVAILQLINQFVNPFNDGQIINIIASQQNSEQYQFIYVLLTSLIIRIQPALIFQLKQDINQRIKQAQELNITNDIIANECNIRQELIQFWNGAEQVMFQLHLHSLKGSFNFVDEIINSLDSEYVIICGKIPQNSKIRRVNQW